MTMMTNSHHHHDTNKGREHMETWTVKPPKALPDIDAEGLLLPPNILKVKRTSENRDP